MVNLKIVSHMCLADVEVASWSVTQDVARMSYPDHGNFVLNWSEKRQDCCDLCKKKINVKFFKVKEGENHGTLKMS